MKKTKLVVALAAAGLAVACAESKGSTGSAQAGVNVKINPQAISRAAQPPPANASSTKTAGKGDLAVNTANSPTDTDPTWIESLDLDLDGNVDAAEYTYDDDDKVTYIYSEVTFPCINGDGQFKGGMLTAVYGLNNTWGKAPGAGWYVVALNAGQCKAEAKALWGCHFDATGQRTDCGWATIQADKDDIIITVGDVK